MSIIYFGKSEKQHRKNKVRSKKMQVSKPFVTHHPQQYGYRHRISSEYLQHWLFVQWACKVNLNYFIDDNLYLRGNIITIDNSSIFYKKKRANPLSGKLFLMKKFVFIFEVVPPRIELGTHGFSVRCSTNWAKAPIVLRVQR